MRISCIYIIKSKVKPERFYIGSAVDFCKRKRSHLAGLKDGTHHSNLLQRHVNKYGIDDISFEILERVYDKELLLKTEQYFFDFFKPYFNTCKVAGSSLGIKMSNETKAKLRTSNTGKKHTDEARKKISLSKKGKVFTEQHRRNLSKGKIGKKYGIRSDEHKRNIALSRIGHKHSMETRRKISAANIGKKMSEEAKAKIGVITKLAMMNGRKEKMRLINTGSKHSEEAKMKISIANSGKIRSKEAKLKMKLSHLGKKQSAKHICNRIESIRRNKLLKLSA